MQGFEVSTIEHMKREDLLDDLKKPIERMENGVANEQNLFDIFPLFSNKISTGKLLLQQFLKDWLHITADAILKVCYSRIAN